MTLRRVYTSVSVATCDGGYGVRLDGRPVKTPRRRALVVPARALARAIAAEWDAQATKVVPRTMPIMRLAATALDIVGPDRAAVVDQVAGYGATDLVCYRAEGPPALVERQHATWQPLVDWAMASLDAPLAITQGVIPIAQPAPCLRALRRAVERCDDWRLAALGSATTAAGSLVIGLALVAGRLDAETAWAVSLVDETFQIERWGADAEASARRAALKETIHQARRFIDLLEG